MLTSEFCMSGWSKWYTISAYDRDRLLLFIYIYNIIIVFWLVDVCECLSWYYHLWIYDMFFVIQYVIWSNWIFDNCLSGTSCEDPVISSYIIYYSNRSWWDTPSLPGLLFFIEPGTTTLSHEVLVGLITGDRMKNWLAISCWVRPSRNWIFLHRNIQRNHNISQTKTHLKCLRGSLIYLVIVGQFRPSWHQYIEAIC